MGRFLSNGKPKSLYDLLTAKLEPYAGEDGSIHFDRIVSVPVDAEVVDLVEGCLHDPDPQTRRAALFTLAGLQDDSPERLEPFKRMEGRIQELLLDHSSEVRCDALMAYAYFDPSDLARSVRDFLTDPAGRNRLQAVKILEAETNPGNIPTLLTLGLDTYHEERGEPPAHWLLVREAAREAIEKTASLLFPGEIARERIDGVACLFHAWDPVYEWAAGERFV